jgi:hypothetical protein
MNLVFKQDGRYVMKRKNAIPILLICGAVAAVVGWKLADG